MRFDFSRNNSPPPYMEQERVFSNQKVRQKKNEEKTWMNEGSKTKSPHEHGINIIDLGIEIRYEKTRFTFGPVKRPDSKKNEHNVHCNHVNEQQ